MMMMKRIEDCPSRKPVAGAAPVVGVVCLFMLGGCMDDFEIDRLTKKMTTLERSCERVEKDIESLQKQAERMQSSASKTLASLKGYEDAIQGKRDAQDRIEQIEPLLIANVALLEAYRGLEVEETNIIAGEVLGELTLLSGEKITNAVVTQHRDGMLGLRHSAGVGFYPIDNLPEEIRKRFMRPLDVTLAASNIDVREVLSSKPTILMSREEQAASQVARNEKARADQNRRNDEKNAETVRLVEERDAKRRAELDARRAKMDADSLKATEERERQKKIRAQVDLVREEVSKYTSAINTEQSAKRSRASEMNGRAARVAAADQAKILAVYDKRIETLNQKVSELMAKIATLEAGL